MNAFGVFVLFLFVTNVNREQYGCAVAVATAGRGDAIVFEYASAAAPVGAVGGVSSTAAASALKSPTSSHAYMQTSATDCDHCGRPKF